MISAVLIRPGVRECITIEKKKNKQTNKQTKNVDWSMLDTSDRIIFTIVPVVDRFVTSGRNNFTPIPVAELLYQLTPVVDKKDTLTK